MCWILLIFAVETCKKYLLSMQSKVRKIQFFIFSFVKINNAHYLELVLLFTVQDVRVEDVILELKNGKDFNAIFILGEKSFQIHLGMLQQCKNFPQSLPLAFLSWRREFKDCHLFVYLLVFLLFVCFFLIFVLFSCSHLVHKQCTES